MKFSAMVPIFGVIGLSALLGEDNEPIYTENIEKWFEVPESIHEEIVTDPWFSNASDWRVFLSDGKANAKPLWLTAGPPLLDLPSGEELAHGASVKIERGWLASYYLKYPINGESINSVYRILENKQRELLLEGGWVMQFLPSKESPDIFAGTPTGIVRFRSDKEWIGVHEVNFSFGMVYGITHFSDGEFLVFSRSGWWKVGKDKAVNQVKSLNGINVPGTSICRVGNYVYLGGQAFVTEINMIDLNIRRLCPSSQYLNAMRTMTRHEFDEFLVRRTQGE